MANNRSKYKKIRDLFILGSALVGAQAFGKDYSYHPSHSNLSPTSFSTLPGTLESTLATSPHNVTTESYCGPGNPENTNYTIINTNLTGRGSYNLILRDAGDDVTRKITIDGSGAIWFNVIESTAKQNNKGHIFFDVKHDAFFSINTVEANSTIGADVRGLNVLRGAMWRTGCTIKLIDTVNVYQHLSGISNLQVKFQIGDSNGDDTIIQTGSNFYSEVIAIGATWNTASRLRLIDSDDPIHLSSQVKAKKLEVGPNTKIIADSAGYATLPINNVVWNPNGYKSLSTDGLMWDPTSSLKLVDSSNTIALRSNVTPPKLEIGDTSGADTVVQADRVAYNAFPATGVTWNTASKLKLQDVEANPITLRSGVNPPKLDIGPNTKILADKAGYSVFPSNITWDPTSSLKLVDTNTATNPIILNSNIKPPKLEIGATSGADTVVQADSAAYYAFPTTGVTWNAASMLNLVDSTNEITLSNVGGIPKLKIGSNTKVEVTSADTYNSLPSGIIWDDTSALIINTHYYSTATLRSDINPKNLIVRLSSAIKSNNATYKALPSGNVVWEASSQKLYLTDDSAIIQFRKDIASPPKLDVGANTKILVDSASYALLPSGTSTTWDPTSSIIFSDNATPINVAVSSVLPKKIEIGASTTVNYVQNTTVYADSTITGSDKASSKIVFSSGGNVYGKINNASIECNGGIDNLLDRLYIHSSDTFDNSVSGTCVLSIRNSEAAITGNISISYLEFRLGSLRGGNVTSENLYLGYSSPISSVYGEISSSKINVYAGPAVVTGKLALTTSSSGSIIHKRFAAASGIVEAGPIFSLDNASAAQIVLGATNTTGTFNGLVISRAGTSDSGISIQDGKTITLDSTSNIDTIPTKIGANSTLNFGKISANVNISGASDSSVGFTNTGAQTLSGSVGSTSARINSVTLNGSNASTSSLNIYADNIAMNNFATGTGGYISGILHGNTTANGRVNVKSGGSLSIKNIYTYPKFSLVDANSQISLDTAGTYTLDVSGAGKIQLVGNTTFGSTSLIPDATINIPNSTVLTWQGSSAGFKTAAGGTGSRVKFSPTSGTITLASDPGVSFSIDTGKTLTYTGSALSSAIDGVGGILKLSPTSTLDLSSDIKDVAVNLSSGTINYKRDTFQINVTGTAGKLNVDAPSGTLTMTGNVECAISIPLSKKLIFNGTSAFKSIVTGLGDLEIQKPITGKVVAGTTAEPLNSIKLTSTAEEVDFHAKSITLGNSSVYGVLDGLITAPSSSINIPSTKKLSIKSGLSSYPTFNGTGTLVLGSGIYDKLSNVGSPTEIVANASVKVPGLGASAINMGDGSKLTITNTGTFENIVNANPSGNSSITFDTKGLCSMTKNVPVKVIVENDTFLNISNNVFNAPITAIGTGKYTFVVDMTINSKNPNKMMPILQNKSVGITDTTDVTLDVVVVGDNTNIIRINNPGRTTKLDAAVAANNIPINTGPTTTILVTSNLNAPKISGDTSGLLKLSGTFRINGVVDMPSAIMDGTVVTTNNNYHSDITLGALKTGVLKFDNNLRGINDPIVIGGNFGSTAIVIAPMTVVQRVDTQDSTIESDITIGTGGMMMITNPSKKTVIKGEILSDDPAQNPVVFADHDVTIELTKDSSINFIGSKGSKISVNNPGGFVTFNGSLMIVNQSAQKLMGRAHGRLLSNDIEPMPIIVGPNTTLYKDNIGAVVYNDEPVREACYLDSAAACETSTPILFATIESIDPNAPGTIMTSNELISDSSISNVTIKSGDNLIVGNNTKLKNVQFDGAKYIRVADPDVKIERISSAHPITIKVDHVLFYTSNPAFKPDIEIESGGLFSLSVDESEEINGFNIKSTKNAENTRVVLGSSGKAYKNLVMGSEEDPISMLGFWDEDIEVSFDDTKASHVGIVDMGYRDCVIHMPRNGSIDNVLVGSTNNTIYGTGNITIDSVSATGTKILLKPIVASQEESEQFLLPSGDTKIAYLGGVIKELSSKEGDFVGIGLSEAGDNTALIFDKDFRAPIAHIETKGKTCLIFKDHSYNDQDTERRIAAVIKSDQDTDKLYVNLVDSSLGPNMAHIFDHADVLAVHDSSILKNDNQALVVESLKPGESTFSFNVEGFKHASVGTKAAFFDTVYLLSDATSAEVSQPIFSNGLMLYSSIPSDAKAGTAYTFTKLPIPTNQNPKITLFNAKLSISEGTATGEEAINVEHEIVGPGYLAISHTDRRLALKRGVGISATSFQHNLLQGNESLQDIGVDSLRADQFNYDPVAYVDISGIPLEEGKHACTTPYKTEIDVGPGIVANDGIIKNVTLNFDDSVNGSSIVMADTGLLRVNNARLVSNTLSMKGSNGGVVLCDEVHFSSMSTVSIYNGVSIEKAGVCFTDLPSPSPDKPLRELKDIFKKVNDDGTDDEEGTNKFIKENKDKIEIVSQYPGIVDPIIQPKDPNSGDTGGINYEIIRDPNANAGNVINDITSDTSDFTAFNNVTGGDAAEFLRLVSTQAGEDEVIQIFDELQDDAEGMVMAIRDASASGAYTPSQDGMPDLDAFDMRAGIEYGQVLAKASGADDPKHGFSFSPGYLHGSNSKSKSETNIFGGSIAYTTNRDNYKLSIGMNYTKGSIKNNKTAKVTKNTGYGLVIDSIVYVGKGIFGLTGGYAINEYDSKSRRMKSKTASYAVQDKYEGSGMSIMGSYTHPLAIKNNSVFILPTIGVKYSSVSIDPHKEKAEHAWQYSSYHDTGFYGIGTISLNVKNDIGNDSTILFNAAFGAEYNFDSKPKHVFITMSGLKGQVSFAVEESKVKYSQSVGVQLQNGNNTYGVNCARNQHDNGYVSYATSMNVNLQW